MSGEVSFGASEQTALSAPVAGAVTPPIDVDREPPPPTRFKPVGWLGIVAVLSAGIFVALTLTLWAQFAAGFMIEDFCYAADGDQSAWQPMVNPYSVGWFGATPACYQVASDGTMLVASDATLAWKLFFGTVVIPTAAGLVVSAVGFRLVSRRRST